MPLPPQQAERLVAELLARGWHVEDDNIVAPDGSIWFVTHSPWVGDLPDFLDRMRARLQRIEGHGWMYSDAEEHTGVYADTAAPARRGSGRPLLR